MKKLALLFSICALTVTLAGCGGGGSSTTSSSTSNVTGVSTPSQISVVTAQ